MVYRNITVNGIDCQYVVGKTHVKIKIPGKGSVAFLKEEIGSRQEHVDFNESTGEVEVCGYTNYSVTPRDISRRIQGMI